MTSESGKSVEISLVDIIKSLPKEAILKALFELGWVEVAIKYSPSGDKEFEFIVWKS